MMRSALITRARIALLLVVFLVECIAPTWSRSGRTNGGCQLVDKRSGDTPGSAITTLECVGLTMGASPVDVALPEVLKRAAGSSLSRVTRLQIRQSNLTHLNMDALTPLKGLTHLEVTHSRIQRVNLAPGHDYSQILQLKSMNLSHNFLLAIDLPSLFPHVPSGPGAALQTLDLSNNGLANISLHTLPELRVVGLRANNFTCRWVRNELYDWWSLDTSGHTLIEANATYCAASEIAFDAIPFPVALSLKQRGVQECEATACSCDVRGYFINKLPNPTFPNVYSSPELNVTITLKVDCGNMSLTELPNITSFATVLSVQHNSIRNLDRISVDPDYRNLVGLDLSYNTLDSIEFLGESRFTDSFTYIILNGNQFHQIPEHVISQIFKETRRSLMKIRLGENEIDCDCFTHTKLRPLLIRNEKVIDDWRNISCRTPVRKSLLDLKRADVCSSTDDPSSNPSLDFLWYTLIVLELLLIFAIVAKVWYDARRYRATGTLPKCSLCIPRLPCDFMLEGLKDSKHGPHDHHNGHGHTHGTGNRRRGHGVGGGTGVSIVGQPHGQGHRESAVSAQSQKLLECHA